MWKRFIKLIILLLMLLGLPLLGIILAHKPISPYLEFPPRTIYVQHAPFSWTPFLCYSLFIIVVIMPFIVRVIKGPPDGSVVRLTSAPFPFWGWGGILLGIIAWILAWNRFSWFTALQIHTFTPLWVAYIMTINALTFRRTGRCIMLNRTPFFLLLFPSSALFWWFFEYLNRFVQNWYYGGDQLAAMEYFWYATLPFSTVLPSVLSTREWLSGFSWPTSKFKDSLPIHLPNPRGISCLVLLFAGMGLLGIGIWPNHLFPLLWVSPLLIIVSIQTLFDQEHILSGISRGDWSGVVTYALAALICGFFWEMWNYYSLAKWRYNIPYVNRFQIFEMPALGYAGYLPFGLECAAISHLLIADSHGDGTQA
ncbi:MAG: hypothetical protein ABII26_03340 [Pseudomonadota bacterium]